MDRGVPAEFSLFVPLHYERNYAYPLVVWLHENGSDETQLTQAVSALSLRNYVALGPRGSEQCVRGGYGWFQTHRAIESTEQSVFSAIESTKVQLNIHDERVFVAGQGHGGTMAFRVAFRNPQYFAGVLSINGPLPEGLRPLAGLKRCRQLPLFWTQCRKDDAFDESLLSEQLKLLYYAGFDLTLRQYPMACPVLDVIMPDANRWLMQRVSPNTVA